MENLALTWEEVEEHLAGIPDLKASRLKRFFGQNHFFKIRYAPGEIIMPRGVCSDFAALHLRGKVRVLFNAPEFAVDKRERESWSRPGPLFRRLENWVLDRTDRLESDTSGEQPASREFTTSTKSTTASLAPPSHHHLGVRPRIPVPVRPSVG